MIDPMHQPMIPKQPDDANIPDREEAFQRGWMAYCSRLAIAENPYDQSRQETLWRRWIDGFTITDREESDPSCNVSVPLDCLKARDE